ncbi:D-amino acid dehydrogenase small subunit [Tritonibacter multivorans]|uniref:D-amino acid dehydrogenase small subunit n=1 Tax=Tritonibacter multivorans TaxID=928856 RepID=A0A0N7M0I2_9RHOB|nr:FAD-dependent oxidoreductase [Tritonibacter multivorans]MDA7420909.1 FAD-dependent oxidoreductase [Tritonibacter multivorans]CUH80537.1 D-amino acid dehydrogenase small subunit [Tritonibacter multivorans]SFC82449.1 D-amino-acid dehydrogenase [Tritonibacter multivorans]
MQTHIVVIGAGVIGISVALRLRRLGHEVTVLDRKGVAAETSQGNAGAFAFTDVMPLASPGILRKAPGWLLDPLGPLSVPPRYALQIAPWLLRLWRASWKDRYMASVAAQSSLMQLARAALERQIADTKGEALIQRDGQLQLYEGEGQFNTSLAGWDMRRAQGIRFDLLQRPEQIAEIQPGLDRRFTHAGFTPDWMNTTDPKRWVDHLAHVFEAAGGRILREDVIHLQPTGEAVKVTHRGGDIRVSKVVLAAGAWSHHLAKALGDKIPLETERGYNTTLPIGAFDVRTHLTFANHGFVVTRINGGVRVGGAVELGGLHLPPNYRRAEALLQKAALFLPGLDTGGGRQWMGFRPSLPDTLPVIGPATQTPHVIYAFGHGHLGLTQSAATAELVGDLVEDKPTEISLAPFRADRF